jgi:hypothetical protein
MNSWFGGVDGGPLEVSVFGRKCGRKKGVMDERETERENRHRPLRLAVRVERWPIAGAFAISRGSKREAVVVVAEVGDGTHMGRGECVPYARYGESVDGVAASIEGCAAKLVQGLSRRELASLLPPGAGRNALGNEGKSLVR